MAILLAPMQGVINQAMRTLLTDLGGYDRCVSEFIRVNDQLYPERVFYRLVPELLQDGKTPTGTPVFVQLLGSAPRWMAANAQRAVALGAPGIDLNFGCPADKVNRNGGGSVLLKTPQRIYEVVAAVRGAVEASIPVTAKIRIGYSDASLLPEVCSAVASAGADELCIHARTRTQGYRPPAHWHLLKGLPIANMRLIVNGEIWSVQDALAARSASGGFDLMLGRGALTYPDLAAQIKAYDAGQALVPLPWAHLLPSVRQYFEEQDQSIPRFVGCRTKQWLSYLRRQYAGAELLFQQIKRLSHPTEILHTFDRHQFQI